MPVAPDDRLLTKVARLYHEDGCSQFDVADRLGLSQAKVSRLLKEAKARGIVTVTVTSPVGVHTDLEADLEAAFELSEAIVVESAADGDQLLRDLGAAAARHLETTLRPGMVLGISSWSDALRATVDAMKPVNTLNGLKVVQILGGVGDPDAERHATELARTLALTVRGEAALLPVPGVVASAAARDVLSDEPSVRRALDLFPTVSVALVGIGAVEPSPRLARSGNVFSDDELADLEQRGAVGDICLRFFDDAGIPLVGPLADRVLGMDLATLAGVPRRIAVAAGERKLSAIAGALRGGLLTQLVTDQRTAEALLEHPAG
ncbi:MAG: sugar-binding transcriptional regulator [Acidimicrobiales bacterium]